MAPFKSETPANSGGAMLYGFDAVPPMVAKGLKLPTFPVQNYIHE